MTLVTSEDLADYLNGPTWTPRQQLHIDGVVLPGIQNELEIYLNRPIEPMHVREPRLVDCDGKVWPTITPVWQVLAIDSMPAGGSITTPVGYQSAVPMIPTVVTAREWDPAGNWMAAPNWLVQQAGPFIFIPGSVWDPSMPSSVRYVVVEYIGGYNGYTDAALKLDMMRVAAREVERLYDRSISLRDGAGQPTGPSDPREKGWTADELAKWDRLRRRVVVG